MTKQWLKETKRSLLLRFRALACMDDEEIRKEFARTFPNLPQNEYPAFMAGYRARLFEHAVDKIIPDALID
jgi:hypothetical protein